MIITKEQQEFLLDEYIRKHHNQDECSGFIDGMNAMMELVDKLLKQK